MKMGGTATHFYYTRMGANENEWHSHPFLFHQDGDQLKGVAQPPVYFTHKGADKYG